MSTSAVHTGDDVPVRQQSASGLRLYILLQLFAGQALFGSTTPLSKIIADAFPVFSAALLRMSIASAVLVIILLMTSHKFTRLCRRDWLAVFGVTFFGMLGVTSLMLFGMRMTSGVIGATVISSTPAVTALAAVIFFGSNMNWTKAGALALAVAGVLAVNLLQQGGDEQPDRQPGKAKQRRAGGEDEDCADSHPNLLKRLDAALLLKGDHFDGARQHPIDQHLARQHQAGKDVKSSNRGKDDACPKTRPRIEHRLPQRVYEKYP